MYSKLNIEISYYFLTNLKNPRFSFAQQCRFFPPDILIFRGCFYVYSMILLVNMNLVRFETFMYNKYEIFMGLKLAFRV